MACVFWAAPLVAPLLVDEVLATLLVDEVEVEQRRRVRPALLPRAAQCLYKGHSILCFFFTRRDGLGRPSAAPTGPTPTWFDT